MKKEADFNQLILIAVVVIVGICGIFCIKQISRASSTGEIPGQALGSYCSDSDNGKAYYTKGTVKTLSSPKTDSCSSATQLIEYYCFNNAARDERYTCPNGCAIKKGECIPCTVAWSNTPVCKDGNVWDYKIDAACIKTLTKKQVCPFGCLNGVCKSLSTGCLSQWLNKPSCKDGNVWDNWQNTDCTTISKQKTKCSYGCMNGACKTSAGGCKSEWMNQQFCSNNNVFDNWWNTDCTVIPKQRIKCTYGCLNGACKSK